MIVIAAIIGAYTLLILYFVYGFDKVAEDSSNSSSSNTQFSVIIPFRNESEHLPQLLKSITELDYPIHSFECLFIDDDSDDNSLEIIQAWAKKTDIRSEVLRNVRKTKSPKKDAIQTAINDSIYDWIITTDADCILPKKWLGEFSSQIKKENPKMLAGPVSLFTNDSSFLQVFQKLDFFSLQGSSIGGFGIGKPFMCNGANLAYKKEVFRELHGFEGNSNIASGDDIFLFEKFIKQYPKDVNFVKSKDAIVSTYSLTSWKEVIQQRIRWASKTGNYNLFFPKLVGLIVFFGNLSLLFVFIPLINTPDLWWAIVILWLIKGLTDSILLNKASKFLSEKNIDFISLIKSSLFYPFFTVYVAMKSLTSSYQWKGRTFVK